MVRAAKGYIGLPLEGYLCCDGMPVSRATIMDDDRKSLMRPTSTAQVAAIAERAFSEVEAPGPGYLAIELGAALGRCHVVGLDISKSFVAMATASAVQAGVPVDFQWGDAAAMPFAADEFDFIVCRAVSFKNFLAQPVKALDEMHRVLRPGGQGLNRRPLAERRASQDRDQCRGRSHEAQSLEYGARQIHVQAHVAETCYRAVKPSFKGCGAGEAAFGGCDIQPESIGLNVWLAKSAA